MCSTSSEYSIKHCISNNYTLFYKMFKEFINILGNLFLEKRREYNKHKLCFFILKELPKYYPELKIDVVAPTIILDVDIYVPAVRLAFNFDNVYNKIDRNVKKKMEQNIEYCKSNGVFLYIFDLDHKNTINKKLMNEYLSEVILKISIHKYTLTIEDRYSKGIANASKSRNLNPPSSILDQLQPAK